MTNLLPNPISRAAASIICRKSVQTAFTQSAVAAVVGGVTYTVAYWSLKSSTAKLANTKDPTQPEIIATRVAQAVSVCLAYLRTKVLIESVWNAAAGFTLLANGHPFGSMNGAIALYQILALPIIAGVGYGLYKAALPSQQ